MNGQTRAFQISFLLHFAMIALTLMGSTFLEQHRKVIVLDFNLLNPVSEISKVEELPPAPLVKMQMKKPATIPILKQAESPPLPDAVPPKSSVPEAPPIVNPPDVPYMETRPMGICTPDPGKTLKESSPGVFGITTSPDNTEGGKALAGTKYLNDHFAYIRNRILGNVSYPDSARRMGWQGKVLLSFIITADGSVKAFKVMQSSGFKILDRSAVESVRDAAPFPRPPGEAQLVLPIHFRLE